MHMQSGIGRAGFLLLALVVFAVGAFGFALTWAAFKASASTFFWMGLGVAGAAMVLLYLFASFAPGRADAPRAPVPAPSPAAPAPKPKAEAQDFEFNDYQPAPKAAPEDLVLPPAFQDAKPPGAEAQAPVEFQAAPKAAPSRPRPEASSGRDPSAWPGQKGQSAWSHHVSHQRRVQDEVADSRRRHEMADRYTQNTPTMRAILEEKPQATPERLADRAPRDMNTDFVAPGMSIGQCGQCKTLLLAPEERPLRLKCPECAKITLLE